MNDILQNKGACTTQIRQITHHRQRKTSLKSPRLRDVIIKSRVFQIPEADPGLWAGLKGETDLRLNA